MEGPEVLVVTGQSEDQRGIGSYVSWMDKVRYRNFWGISQSWACATQAMLWRMAR